MKPEKDIVIYLQEESVRGLDMRLRPAETTITGKPSPPAKLPDACPHCGAEPLAHKGNLLWNKYKCGLVLDRDTATEFPEEEEPCGAPKPSPGSQEDARRRSEKARAEEWAKRQYAKLAARMEEQHRLNADFLQQAANPLFIVSSTPPNPQPSGTNGFPDRCPECGEAEEDPYFKLSGRIKYKCGAKLNFQPDGRHLLVQSCKSIPSPNPKPEQNTMASTNTPDNRVIVSSGSGREAYYEPQQVQPLPAPGTKWAYETSNGIRVGVVKSAGLSGIYLDAGKTHGIYTPAEWNSLTRTQLPSKHDALRIPRRGPSRIKWFTVGAAACFFGRPFLPELWSAVAGYVSRLM